jgi:hypothetical protein
VNLYVRPCGLMDLKNMHHIQKRSDGREKAILTTCQMLVHVRERTSPPAIDRILFYLSSGRKRVIKYIEKGVGKP